MKLGRMVGFLVVGALLGCGGNTGPARHRISGSVAIDNKPIPFGEIIFTPDATKKASGPQGRAPIKDGRYDTNFSGGLGIAGGPIVIRVNGLSGPGGKTLCEYELAFDLPSGESTKDINIPAKDAHNANPKGGGKNAPEI